jgi:hypothetical protein
LLLVLQVQWLQRLSLLQTVLHQVLSQTLRTLKMTCLPW